jgi:hypothetical protein
MNSVTFIAVKNVVKITKSSNAPIVYTPEVHDTNDLPDMNDYLIMGGIEDFQREDTAVAFNLEDWDQDSNPWDYIANEGEWFLDNNKLEGATWDGDKDEESNDSRHLWLKEFEIQNIPMQPAGNIQILRWEYRGEKMIFEFTWELEFVPNSDAETNMDVWIKVVPIYNTVKVVKGPGGAVKVRDRYPLANLTVLDISDIARTLETMCALDNPERRLEFISDMTNVAPLMGLQHRDFETEELREFKVVGLSHRASLVTGFYDTPLPYPATYKTFVQTPSAPYVYHGNMMYLISKNGNAIHSANVQHPGVLFRINEFLMSTLPIIIKPREEDRDVVIGDGSSMREIELKLVDRWFEPIKIINPMIVTIKMEPIMEEQVWYG